MLQDSFWLTPLHNISGDTILKVFVCANKLHQEHFWEFKKGYVLHYYTIIPPHSKFLGTLPCISIIDHWKNLLVIPTFSSYLEEWDIFFQGISLSLSKKHHFLYSSWSSSGILWGSRRFKICPSTSSKTEQCLWKSSQAALLPVWTFLP